jgi:hypothetical protein
MRLTKPERAAVLKLPEEGGYIFLNRIAIPRLIADALVEKEVWTRTPDDFCEFTELGLEVRAAEMKGAGR